MQAHSSTVLETDSLDGSESDSGDEAPVAGPSGVKRERDEEGDAAAAGPSAPSSATIAVGIEFADEAALRAAVAAFAASTQPPTSVTWGHPYANDADATKQLALRCVCAEKNRHRCRWAIHAPVVDGRFRITSMNTQHCGHDDYPDAPPAKKRAKTEVRTETGPTTSKAESVAGPGGAMSGDAKVGNNRSLLSVGDKFATEDAVLAAVTAFAASSQPASRFRKEYTTAKPNASGERGQRFRCAKVNTSRCRWSVQTFPEPEGGFSITRINDAHCGHDGYPDPPPFKARTSSRPQAADSDGEDESDRDEPAKSPPVKRPTASLPSPRVPPTPSLSPGAPDALEELLGSRHRALRPVAAVLREAGVDSVEALLALKRVDWAELCGMIEVKPFQSVLLARVDALLSS